MKRIIITGSQATGKSELARTIIGDGSVIYGQLNTDHWMKYAVNEKVVPDWIIFDEIELKQSNLERMNYLITMTAFSVRKIYGKEKETFNSPSFIFIVQSDVRVEVRGIKSFHLSSGESTKKESGAVTMKPVHFGFKK